MPELRCHNLINLRHSKVVRWWRLGFHRVKRSQNGLDKWPCDGRHLTLYCVVRIIILCMVAIGKISWAFHRQPNVNYLEHQCHNTTISRSPTLVVEFAHIWYSERLIACPHCRRKVRQSPNFAVVSLFLATISLLCDSLTFLRQCGQGLRQMLSHPVSCWLYQLLNRPPVKINVCCS